MAPIVAENVCRIKEKQPFLALGKWWEECGKIGIIFKERRRITMDQTVRDYVVEQTHRLMEAFSCSGEAKEAAQAWLAALGTDREAEETRKYVQELEEDLVTVDQLIAFAESDEGRQVFGAEAAPGVAAHGREIKAAGAKYCDCPACAAAAAILEKKDLLLK